MTRVAWLPFVSCKAITLAVVLSFGSATVAYAESLQLPRRISSVPGTTNSVPHVQIDVSTDPTLSAELLRQVAKFPGVDVRVTGFSLHGTKGFWINEKIEIVQPDRIVGGREFAHMHPDGSLHASLSSEHALEAVQRGWATFHPWSTERPRLQGYVMIYTPQSDGELQVILRLVRASYDFVIGKS